MKMIEFSCNWNPGVLYFIIEENSHKSIMIARMRSIMRR